MQVSLTPATGLIQKACSAIQTCHLPQNVNKLDELIFQTKRVADISEKTFKLSEEATKASQEMFKQNALTGGFFSKIAHNLSIFLPVGLITGLVSSVSLPIVTAKLVPWLNKLGLI